MEVLLSFFGGCAAGFLSLLMLLRFEPDLVYVFGSLRKRGLIQPFFASLGSEFQEIVEGAVEGAVVNCLIPDKERELFLVLIEGEIFIRGALVFNRSRATGPKRPVRL